MLNHCLVLLCCTLLATLATAQSLIPEHWLRAPEIGVPQLQQAPVIDGTVNVEEWQGAFKTVALYSNHTGAVKTPEAELYLGWQPGTLYVAWRLRRNADDPAPRATFSAGHHPFIWTRDDNVEVTVQSGTAGNLYTLAGNSTGAWSDGQIFSTVENNWNGDWFYASRQVGNGWEGELRIPDSGFDGFNPVQAGNSWQFDWFAHNRTPRAELVALANVWAYKGGYRQGPKATLHFRPGPAAMRIDFAGKRPDGSIGWSGRIVNGNGTIASDAFAAPPLNAEELDFFAVWDRIEFVRKTGEKVEEGRTIAFQKGVEDYFRDLNLRYRPALQETRSAADGAEIPFSLPGMTGGEFAFNCTARAADGSLLLNQSSNVRIPEVLDTSVIPNFLEKKLLKIEAELQHIPGRAADGRLHLNFCRQGEPNVLVSTTWEDDGQALKARLLLPVGDTQPGMYELRLVYQLQDKVLATRSVILKRPETPAWWGNTWGLQAKTPPPPWTPLQLNPTASGGFRVGTWQREVEFTETPLAISIKTRGEALLAAPLTLTLAANGKPQELKTVEWRQVEANAMQAVLLWRGASPELQAEIRLICDYDGAWRTELTLAPPAGTTAVRVDKMTLTIPVRQEFAVDYLTGAWYTNPAKVRISTAIPGSVDAVANWPKNFPQGIPFTYALFLGCFDRGIEFFADNDRNWSNRDESRVMQLRRDDKSVTLEIAMIDQPVNVDSKLDFAWGVLPLPIKDGRRGLTELERRFGDNLSILGAENETPQLQAQLDIVRSGLLNFGSFYMNMSDTGHFGSPRTFAPKWDETMRRAVKRLRAAAPGLQLAYYSSWGVNANFPDGEVWSEEMLMEPKFNCGFGGFWHNPASRAYQDWYLYHVAYMVKEVGLTGVKLDGTFSPLLTTNDEYGFAFVRHGVRHGSYPVFACRAMARRLYTALHGELCPNGVIDLHGETALAIMGYSDIRHIGESEYKKGTEVLQIMTPEQFRGKFATQGLGLPCVMLWPEWMNLPVKRNEMRSLSLLHDIRLNVYIHNADRPEDRHYEREALPWGAITRALQSFDRINAQWIPYWENKLVQTGDAALPVSCYLHPGKRVLAVISNPATTGKLAALKLDLPAMQLADKRLWFFDALTGHPLKADPDGLTRLQIYPQSYRMIQIDTRRK